VALCPTLLLSISCHELPTLVKRNAARLHAAAAAAVINTADVCAESNSVYLARAKRTVACKAQVVCEQLDGATKLPWLLGCLADASVWVLGTIMHT
jgi:hypothetical protein